MIFLSKLGSHAARISNLERKKRKRSYLTGQRKLSTVLEMWSRVKELGLPCLFILIHRRRLQALAIMTVTQPVSVLHS